ncbi:MAG: hypothetical protein AAB358_01475 [Patescibacteria group bacterium]
MWFYLVLIVVAYLLVGFYFSRWARDDYKFKEWRTITACLAWPIILGGLIIVVVFASFVVLLVGIFGASQETE